MTEAAQVKLRWEPPLAQSAGAAEIWASFRPYIGSDPLPVIRLVVNYSDLGAVGRAVGTADPLEGRARLAAYTIARLEADVEVWNRLQQLDDRDAFVLTLDATAAGELASFSVKACDRQVREGRDLWCDAASGNDDTATVTLNGRLAAPTSAPICAECSVPDSRLRCSAFMHPSVTSVRTLDGSHERLMSWAICDAGHQERITGHPELCIPETGHDCWHRFIAIGPEDPAVLLDPLTLPDTLDRLDDVWRLAFRSHVVAVNSAADVASLTLEAGTRERFMDRIRAVAEILGAFTIDAALIPADTDEAYKAGSLNRLETALRGGLTAEEGQTVADTVRVLRRVRRLDNALQHPTGEVATLFGEFGIAYPPIDWQRAWEVVRAALVDALRALIRLTRDVADAADTAEDAGAAEDDGAHG